MKLLVLSDSHGHDEKLVDIIAGHEDADAILFLGDGERDFDIARDSGFVRETQVICQVRGNCDLCSREPDKLIREFGGVRVLITHGHEQNVKCGVWGLVEEAKRHQCQAALFGHTHFRTHMVREGIMLINPGSAGQGSYCVVEAADGTIRVIDE